MSAPSSTTKAMVLAAGFGKRLRPLTLEKPKPLVSVAGRTLLDRTLDMVEAAGIGEAIVNVHYLGQQIIDHCATRKAPVCLISDERDAILETGGGVVRALPRLGLAPFVVLNADTFWIENGESNIAAMLAAFDPASMDMMLMVASPSQTTGHSGGLDFAFSNDQKLRRWRAGEPDASGMIYAGAAIIDPAILAGAPEEPHSLNRYFDAAIGRDRLAGWAMRDSHWYTVGTPDDLARVEHELRLGQRP